MGKRKPRPSLESPKIIWLFALLCGVLLLMIQSAGTRGSSAPPSNQLVHESNNPPGNDSDSDSLTSSPALDRIDGYPDHARSIASDPYYYLLHEARSNPPSALSKNARRDVTFAQLIRDPDEYRGQLVGFQGRLRRLIRDTCDPNEFELATRFEGWLYTNDSGRNPICVVVTDPPDGIPLGGNINHPVEVAGYFLGWWKYQSSEGRAHTAPILLARRFESRRAATSLEVDPLLSTPSLIAGTAFGLLILLGFGAAYFLNRPSHKPPVDDASPLVFEEPDESR